MAIDLIIPEWFTLGLKFTSTYINDGLNLCELMNFDIPNNTCTVQISIPNSTWTEDWDLQHTIWGFENRDYTIYSSGSN